MRALALALLLAAPVSAEIAAVRSSDTKPYREAVEGLREGLGRDTPFTLASPDDDPAVDTLIAFGAKAALSPHANARTVIVALAPAYAPARRAAGCVVEVSVMPSPAAVIAGLRRLQPGIKGIWIPWLSRSFEPYMNGLKAAGGAVGIDVDADRLDKAEDLPARLRRVERRPTAILVPPDPELVSRFSFEILRQAARADKIPLYAPFSSLIDSGATASIGTSFREMGRTAGLTASRPEARARCGAVVYPERSDIRVSLSAAAEAGLPSGRSHYEGFAEVLP